MKIILKIMMGVCLLIAAGCTPNHSIRQRNSDAGVELYRELCKISNEVPGVVGVAYVSARDTICINNGVLYPMMSVFKLHEALAVENLLNQTHASADSLIEIKREELDPETWSPMLKKYPESGFKVSIRELVEYALKSSDNNASNILFSRIVSPSATNEYVKSVAQDTTFAIRYTEAEMKTQHSLAYDNYTSPLAAALLIKQVCGRGSSMNGQLDISSILSEVTTGQDRLGAPIQSEEGIFFAHKTGSGYRNERDELVAHNDVGFFRLPEGTEYSLAVFIRDFRGTETEASRIIARISELFYNYSNK